MLDMIRQWVLGLAGTALCCAVLTEITPKGSVKNVVKALCGMLMALAAPEFPDELHLRQTPQHYCPRH